MTTTAPKHQRKPFKSYEELERELMPKRAESRRSGRDDTELRDRSLEIVRRSVANALRVQDV